MEISHIVAHLSCFMQEALSTVDVLAAFGAFTETTVGNTCRPLILPATSQGGAGAVLELKGLWNPCAVPLEASGCIVPNDLCLGSRYTPFPQCTRLLGSLAVHLHRNHKAASEAPRCSTPGSQLPKVLPLTQPYGITAIQCGALRK